jgi:hypothetical protein
MKIAYLILAHNNPGHLARLTQALVTPNTAIFIHIDKKTDIRPFLEIAGENIQFTPERVAVYWGDYSTTEAILILINAAMAGSEHIQCGQQHSWRPIWPSIETANSLTWP